MRRVRDGVFWSNLQVFDILFFTASLLKKLIYILSMDGIEETIAHTLIPEQN